MFRIISAFVVAILAISTSLVGVDAVHAQEVESTEVPGIATTEDGSETITTILGGTTQSTDPTRYDYVPPADDGMIRPMDAYGIQFVGGFSYTYKGVTIRIPAAYIGHDVKSKGLVISKQEALFSLHAQQLPNLQLRLEVPEPEGVINLLHKVGWEGWLFLWRSG